MAVQPQKQDIDIIVKKIVYGSVAFWLGKKADELISHKWCVYVRGLENEDISYFVKKVIFTLHPSFENHQREVTKFPFELYESGWGQFDIIITIYLIDETSKPIEFVHPLKLYPTQAHASMSTKKPVVSESYEEIVFVNPKPHIKEILNNSPIKSHSSIQIPLVEEDKNVDSYFSDDKMQVEKTLPKPSDILLKDTSMRITNTFNENFNNLNINTQMEISPSNIISPSFQKKVDDLNIDSTMGNNLRFGNTFLGDFNQMQLSQDMLIDNSLDPSQHNAVNFNLIKEKSVVGGEKKPYSNFIPDIQQYFQRVDDSADFKILEEANKFVLQEILRYRKSLENSEKEIGSIKKSIKELLAKIN